MGRGCYKRENTGEELGKGKVMGKGVDLGRE